ncbi:hypothetical protein ACFL09_00540 [Planctomycetota bacterium]
MSDVSRKESVAAVIVFSTLLFYPAFFCFLLSRGVGDADVWWHVKSGEWIVQHRGWPTVDVFSSHAGGSPWLAYSWLPELLLYGLYQVFGPRGLVLYTAALSTCVIGMLHRLVWRYQPYVLRSCMLTAAAAFGLIPVFTPRPWLLSMLFLVIELDLLLRSARQRDHRALLWLPPLFCIWANSHIEFALGLAVLALAVVASFLQRLDTLRGILDEQHLPSPRRMVLLLVLCASCALISPYGYRVYGAALACFVQGSTLSNVIDEFIAPRFRHAPDWVFLSVVVAAAFVAGWRRRVTPLLALLYLLSLWLGFRSGRGTGPSLVIGVVVVACALPQYGRSPRHYSVALRMAILACVALMMGGGFLSLNESRLGRESARQFPAHAVEFIQQQEYVGPIFNSFGWGGYLICHLPQFPVSIDGRGLVHGNERIARHMETQQGRESWRTDPELMQAKLILLPKHMPLASVLRAAPRFRVVYEDEVAVVLVPQGEEKALQPG